MQGCCRATGRVIWWKHESEVADAMVQPAPTVTERSASGDAEALKVRSLSVDRYRVFHALRIGNLGRVNLFVGQNNTGKSSILEAIRILAHRGTPRVIEEILTSREESGFSESRAPSSIDNLSLVGTLFHGSPFQRSNPTLDADSISVKIEGTLSPASLTMSIADAVSGADQTQATAIEDPPPDGGPALVVGIDDEQVSYPIDRLSSYVRRPWKQDPLQCSLHGPSNDHHPCVSIDAYMTQDTSCFGSLWDKITLSDDEKYVVQALRMIEPKIMAVSMIGDGHASNRRRVIVRTSDFKNPVTFRSFGDGMNRLFGIILSLVNARGGLLLIDEFESGLHHSVQFEVWKMILELAGDLDVQVFATSHSWDAIKAFGQAAGKNERNEAVLVKLERIHEQIIPTVFEGDDLRIIADQRIEVR